MCNCCANFDKHNPLVMKINSMIRDAAIPIDEGIALLLYMCAIWCATPDDVTEDGCPRVGEYEPCTPEGMLKEVAWTNIEAAYRRVRQREERLRRRKGGLTH